MLVGGGPHGGRLHDDVVDESAGDEEVGEEHEAQHLVGGGLPDEGGSLQADLGRLQKGEGGTEQEVHLGVDAGAGVHVTCFVLNVLFAECCLAFLLLLCCCCVQMSPLQRNDFFSLCAP